MRNESLTARPANRLFSILTAALELLLPVAYFFVMFQFFPFRNIFEGDTDEGINLMKALLVERGYPLYQSIWSDQPPLFTHLLVWSFREFGLEVNVGRTLVLVFSSLLVLGLVITARRLWGGWHAMAVLLLVVLLPFFPQLSTQVLIGLPAISLAVLSLGAITIWHGSRNPLLLLVSAVALAFSVLIKLFTGLLAPIFMVGLLLDGFYVSRENTRVKKPWLPLQFWTIAFVVVLVVLGLWLVGLDHLQELLLPHLASQNIQAFKASITSFSIESYLLPSWPLLALALVGVFSAIWRRRWLAFYPLAWVLAGYTLLKLNSTVWYHHQLLVTIPAVILAAGAAGDLVEIPLDWLRERRLSRSPESPRLPATARRYPLGQPAWFGWILWLPALILTGLVLGQRLPVVIPEFTRTPYTVLQAELEPPKELRIVREIERYAAETQWMVTDVPMYAFRAGVLVPPELAVFSSKRVASGDLNESRLLELIDRYDPKLILWGRYDFIELRRQLTSRYQEKYAFHGKVLYIRIDE